MTPILALDSLLDAIIFATKKHQGQVRKDSHGSPYITHPLTVAQVLWEIGGITDITILVSAILHDTLEDTNTSNTEISELFSDDILSIVLALTDDKTLDKMERKRMQVIHARGLSYTARVIKLADKLVNCRDILLSPPKGWTLERRRAYIQWAADVIDNIRGTNTSLEDAFDQMLTDAEQALAYHIKPSKSVDQRPWGPTR